MQQAEDRLKRASQIFDSAKLEVKKLESDVATTKKEAERAGAKYPKLVSTWAQAERDKLSSASPATTQNVPSMPLIASQKNESKQLVPLQQAKVRKDRVQI